MNSLSGGAVGVGEVHHGDVQVGIRPVGTGSDGDRIAELEATVAALAAKNEEMDGVIAKVRTRCFLSVRRPCSVD